MPLSTARKRELAAQYGAHEGDVGGTKVQVAMLTERINHLNDSHLRAQPRTTTRAAGC